MKIKGIKFLLNINWRIDWKKTFSRSSDSAIHMNAIGSVSIIYCMEINKCKKVYDQEKFYFQTIYKTKILNNFLFKIKIIFEIGKKKYEKKNY